MRVLALDLARNAGWAVVDGGIAVAHGSWPLADGIATGKAAPPLDVQHVLLVQELRTRILDVVARFSPETVAIEREFGRGSGTRLLVSLYTAAQEAAYVSRLSCLGVRLGDWRKHIHGSAGKKTEWFKAEALRLVPDAVDADAAEAVLIGRYVAANAVVRTTEAAPRKRRRVAA